jgi:Mg2+ and Co2+ transporter CorA
MIGQWRAHLHSLQELLEIMRVIMQLIPGELLHFSNDECTQHLVLYNTALAYPTSVFDKLRAESEAVLAHCESTFTALMGTMSIIESGKAINEAEQVTKLTQLAFFFIPLTFVAGVFGMNLAVSLILSA